MKVVIEIDDKVYKHIKEHNGLAYAVEDYLHEVEWAIKKGTPLPQNATNGEMIQALFTNGAVAVMSYPSNKVGFITRDGNPDDNYVWYPTSWWNAPYKADKENEDV